MTTLEVTTMPAKAGQHAREIALAMMAEGSDLWLYRGDVYRMTSRLDGSPLFEKQTDLMVRNALAESERVIAKSQSGGQRAVARDMIREAIRLFVSNAPSMRREVEAEVKYPVMVRHNNSWAALRQLEPGVHESIAVTARKDMLAVPVIANDGDFRAAVTHLMLPLREFAFQDKRHKALALAAMLTASTRPTLRTAPAIVVEAPIPRSGKTLLAQVVCAMVPGGNDTNPTKSLPRNEEELEKRLQAWLVEDAILIDNLRQRLASPAIEAMITVGVIDVREAGQWASTEVLTTRTLLAITGNNSDVSDDMRRRSLNIRLAGVLNPQNVEHSFDPLDEVRAARDALAGAAISAMDYAQGRAREQWLRDVSPDFADVVAPAVRLACELIPDVYEWPATVVEDALGIGGDAEVVREVIVAALSIPTAADRLIDGVLTTQLIDDVELQVAVRPLRDSITSRVHGSRAWTATTLGKKLRAMEGVPCEFGALRQTAKQKSTAAASGSRKWRI